MRLAMPDGLEDFINLEKKLNNERQSTFRETRYFLSRSPNDTYWEVLRADLHVIAEFSSCDAALDELKRLRKELL